MRGRLLATLVAATAVVALAGWSATRGDGAPVAAPEIVTVEVGAVTATVGGIGNVATLTEAARLAAPVTEATAGTSSTASSGGGSSAGAVFSTATGHVTDVFVRVGDKVNPGEPIARISDDGTSLAALVQARSDLSMARLELAQKRVQDPLRGQPPTAAERALARQAVRSAQANLRRISGRPLAADLTAAELEVARAVSELEAERTTRADRPGAIAAAERAVTAARQRLEVMTGAPDPAEVSAAQLEVARAQLEQETLLRPPPAPSVAAVAAADADVAAAQQRLAAAILAPVPADIATARAEVARAESDREALTRPPAPPTPAAEAAARLAVETAQQRLNQLLAPPPATVSVAQTELARAEADLAAVRATGSTTRTAASKTAVRAARQRLDLLLNPAPEAVQAARTEVSRAAADLSVLRQRGAPASAIDLAIARLRVSVGGQQVQLAEMLAGRQTVLARSSGTVTSILTAKGAAVDPTVPLVRVQDLDNLVVSLNLTEFDVSRTQVGAPAMISADALGGRRFSGRVLDVGLSGRETGGVVTFPVIVSVDEAKRLRPAMSVSVRIVTQRAEDVVLLPLSAIDEQDGKDAVIRVRTPAGTLKQRDVELGVVGTSYAEVRDGLEAGEKVAIPADEQ